MSYHSSKPPTTEPSAGRIVDQLGDIERKWRKSIMRAVEFQAQLTSDGSLAIPASLLSTKNSTHPPAGHRLHNSISWNSASVPWASASVAASSALTSSQSSAASRIFDKASSVFRPGKNSLATRVRSPNTPLGFSTEQDLQFHDILPRQ